MTQAHRLFAALDVAYTDGRAYGACVTFQDWRSSAPLSVITAETPVSAAYEPGAFFKRELQVLVTLLNGLHPEPTHILVDGYAHFGGPAKPGLGARLRAALEDRPAIVGVAKSPLSGDDWSERAIRGKSAKPLFVTSAGMAEAEAAAGVCAMHGAHRIPTLLALADRIARDLVAVKG